MSTNETVLLAMGISLTLLALVSGFFILSEVVLLVRELGGGRRPTAWQLKTGARKPADTGPLGQHGLPTSDTQTDPAARVADAIQPVRDAQVIRQLIGHFEGDAADSEETQQPEP